MPELPEAETVRRGLEELLLGAQLDAAEVFALRPIRRQIGGSAQFTDLLIGREITEVARRGKFLWLNLASKPDLASAKGPVIEGEKTSPQPSALVVHLGMSGQLRELTDTADTVPTRHERVRLSYRDANGNQRKLSFVDQRMFGSIYVDELIATPDGLAAGEGTQAALLPASAQHIARDLLDPALDEDALIKQLRSRKAPIKNLLLQQNLVSGIGNIYADEALFAARIHGATPAERLSPKNLRETLRAGRKIMEAALNAGGTSFDALYVAVNGESGTFSQSLQVYGRAGKQCPRCETQLESCIIGGRSHSHCPRCQKKPRPSLKIVKDK